MKKVVVLASVAIALAATWAIAPAGAGKRSDSVVKIKATLDKDAPAGKAVVVLHLDIAKGWHLYANPVGNEDLDGSSVTVKVLGANGAIKYPAGKVITDKTLGKYNIYEDKIEIRATVDRAENEAGPIDLAVRLQACDDKNCLPPATVKLSVK